MEHILSDSHIWVTISFLFFVIMSYKAGKRVLFALLDKRIREIKHEIDTAESIRVQAQELLAQYQRKQKDTAIEAQNIIEKAHEHAEQIKKRAEEELEISMQRKEAQLKERIRLMEIKSKKDIKNYAIDMVVSATEDAIKNNLKNDKDIINSSIDNIKSSIAKTA